MSSELATTLIAAATSIVVVILSKWVEGIIGNRQSAQKARETLSDARLNQSLGALELAIQSIQRFQDEIELIRGGWSQSTLDAEAAVEHITNARRDLFTCYQQQLAHLNDQEANALANAKAMSRVCEGLITGWLKERSSASELTDKEKGLLKDLCDVATTSQLTLQQQMATRIRDRLTAPKNTKNHDSPVSPLDSVENATGVQQANPS